VHASCHICLQVSVLAMVYQRLYANNQRVKTTDWDNINIL